MSEAASFYGVAATSGPRPCPCCFDPFEAGVPPLIIDIEPARPIDLPRPAWIRAGLFGEEQSIVHRDLKPDNVFQPSFRSRFRARPR